jgi:uncharacterized protein
MGLPPRRLGIGRDKHAEAVDVEGAGPVGGQRHYRVKPSVWAGLVVYAAYLAVFYTTWAVNDVDYDNIGKTVESAKLHYAFPTLFGGVTIVILVTAFGWWKPSLFERERSGPRWAWISVVAILVLGTIAYFQTNVDNVTGQLILWSVLGAIGVGFGEEMITRGSMVVGLRSKFDEHKVWLYSTLLFAALHIPNAFFGEGFGPMLVQLVSTFIIGSLLFAIRRVSGTLILCMFLHGFWDTSIFLPRASGVEGNILAFLLFPIAIVVAWAVVKRNGHKRILP